MGCPLARSLRIVSSLEILNDDSGGLGDSVSRVGVTDDYSPSEYQD